MSIPQEKLGDTSQNSYRAKAPNYQNSKADDFAFYRRRTFSNTQAMSGRILQATGYPTKRHRDFICALQSVQSGDGAKIKHTPFRRAHLTLARYMQVSGSEECRRKFIYRETVTLRDFTKRTGVVLFHVTPGNEEESTEYIDYLTPAADEAMQRALSSPLWKTGKQTDKQKAIDEAVAWAVEQLPRVDVEEEKERAAKPLPLREYEKTQEERALSTIEGFADEIEKRGGDSDLWLQHLEARISLARQSRKKTERARRGNSAPSIFDTNQAAESGANGNTKEEWDNFDARQHPAQEGEGETEVSAPPEENASKNAASDAGDAPNMLECALAYARRGEAVVPLHTPNAEGKCSCHKAKCPTVGKHPRILEWQKKASTDEETIRRWWRMWPDANIGIATGEASGFDCLDVDPRHGGDVALTELIEKHGELPKTAQVKTGGGGCHLRFAHSGIQFKNSASDIGKGLDIKTTGGLVVAPPSHHVSGKRYEWVDTTEPAALPEWLLEELTKPKPKRGGKGSGKLKAFVYTAEGPPIPEGKRNKQLFCICSSMRGDGMDQEQIEKAALEINAARCQPPMEEEEVLGIAESVMRYDPNVIESEVVQ